MSHHLENLKFCTNCGTTKFNKTSNISKKCTKCGQEFYKNPAIGAGCIILDDKDRLLAIRRAKEPAKGTLGLAGGFADIEETIEQTLIREAKEEINIDIEVEEYFFSIPNSYIYQGINLHPLDFFFKCRIKDMSDMKIDPNEIMEIVFIDKDKINPDDFGLASNKEAIARIIEQNLI